MSNTFIITKYLGISYKERGRTIEGLDCWGLIIMIYKDMLNVDVLDLENYDAKWSWKGKDYFRQYYDDRWDRVSKPQLLDIVLLKNSKNISNHAGVMLNDGRFVHCIKAGVVVSMIQDKIWKDRITGFFRYKND